MIEITINMQGIERTYRGTLEDLKDRDWQHHVLDMIDTIERYETEVTKLKDK